MSYERKERKRWLQPDKVNSVFLSSVTAKKEKERRKDNLKQTIEQTKAKNRSLV